MPRPSPFIRCHGCGGDTMSKVNGPKGAAVWLCVECNRYSGERGGELIDAPAYDIVAVWREKKN